MDTLPTNGNQLQIWRGQRGLSQRTIGAIVGASQQNVGNWEFHNTTLHRLVVERLAEFTQNPDYRAEHKLPARRGRPHPNSFRATDDNVAACNYHKDALPPTYDERGVMRLETLAEYKKRKDA